LERAKESKLVSDFCVATTNESGVEAIIDIAKKANVMIFQGSLDDVLDRFYQAALKFRPDYLVRVTSDCPLIDPKLIDQVIEFLIESNVDYASNTFREEFPDGQDIEAFSFKSLVKAWKQATLPSEREHVTPFIKKNSDINGGILFKSAHFQAPDIFEQIRMTVDEPEDLEAIKLLVDKLGTKASWLDYAIYILNNKNEFTNQYILRNEGYLNSLADDKFME
jgi:spore coat polysaccharide biosynthesis protein SpsF (cytidylyltransferase family)